MNYFHPFSFLRVFQTLKRNVHLMELVVEFKKAFSLEEAREGLLGLVIMASNQKVLVGCQKEIIF